MTTKLIKWHQADLQTLKFLKLLLYDKTCYRSSFLAYYSTGAPALNHHDWSHASAHIEYRCRYQELKNVLKCKKVNIITQWCYNRLTCQRSYLVYLYVILAKKNTVVVRLKTNKVSLSNFFSSPSKISALRCQCVENRECMLCVPFWCKEACITWEVVKSPATPNSLSVLSWQRVQTTC